MPAVATLAPAPDTLVSAADVGPGPTVNGRRAPSQRIHPEQGGEGEGATDCHGEGGRVGAVDGLEPAPET
jgi:hypothetical protein